VKAHYRISAPSIVERVAIAAPAGDLYGDRICMGWQHGPGEYAVQMRDYRMVRHVKRLKGARLWSEGMSEYLRTFILPMSEAEGRRLVDFLRKDCGDESGEANYAHRLQSNGSPELRISSEKAKMEYTPAATTIAEDAPNRESDDAANGWDWTWREGRLDVVGVDCCEAFPRFDGQWVVQIREPRLADYFNKRKGARVCGRCVADYGWVRQYAMDCDSKAKGRSIVKAALRTLPEYPQHEREGMAA